MSRKFFSMILSLSLITILSGLGDLVLNCKAAEPYKIGAVFSVTGRGSFLGDPEMKTVGMIAKKINESGGINGHPLKIISYDDKSQEEKCISAVRTLIEKDKVLAIIGPSLSGLSLEVLPIVQKAQVPMISCAASWKIVTKDRDSGEQHKWVFKTPQSDIHAVRSIYTHMQQRGISRIAIMSAQTGFGDSGRKELLRMAPNYGIEIVADERYSPNAVEMTSQLEKIRDLNPQAIVNWSIGPTQVMVLITRQELDMGDIDFYQSHGFGSRENIKAAKGSAEGVFCPLGACNIARELPRDHPQKKVTMQYMNNYFELYKEPVSSFGGHAWDALHLVIKALEQGSPDPSSIRNQLEKINGFVGQHGIFNLSAQDHNGLDKDSFYMVVVKNGEWELAK